MKTVVINSIAITAEELTIRQSGSQAELTADGTRIAVNFTNQPLVMQFIATFTGQYPFVAVEKNTARALDRMLAKK